LRETEVLVRKLTLLLAASVTLFSGCSDYSLQKKVEYAPEIYVTPLEHDFGPLNAEGQSDLIEVRISNIGNDVLELDRVFLSIDTENFTLDPVTQLELDPGEDVIANITYDPRTYETNGDELIIISNDEDEHITVVHLDGSGDAPIIDVSPVSHDFEMVYLGCDDTLEIEIGNLGNVDLEIDQVDYYASVPTDFYPMDYEAEFGPYPWIIPPGDVLLLDLDFIPLDAVNDNGYFEIQSNDPVTPVETAAQVGEGAYESITVDSFEQEGVMGSDILFVIDNSGSMCGNQTQLANNFDTFINIISASGYDYQIAFITTDNYEFVGDIITPLTPDPATEAASQITGIGCGGSAHEKGMDMSWNATMGTGDAAPGSAFLRDDAKLVVIYLSDEDDFSTVSPSTMAGRLASLKTSSDFAVAHAVAGDVPGGCTANGGAQAGTDYYDLVNLTGGTFLSICAEDWGTPMEELARESLAVSAFYLTGDPIEDTISAEIDGVITTDWSYDLTINAVIFSVVPPDGALIDITYATWAECDEE
tara:strand:- start:1250 stop:2845 length:1596 start_codon:yes stop_codon:yes gene_type:complete